MTLAQPAPAARDRAPRMTGARQPLLREIEILDEYGARRTIHIPAERPPTVFVDKRELVTLMTLGAEPELLVLGYLRNQRLVSTMDEVESITVDWEVGAAAVYTRHGLPDLAARTARRTVTTGCGQGTVFGDLINETAGLTLPPAERARISQPTLAAMLETMRQQDSIHRKAGSVHGCALFLGREMLMFVEDVGRHNAIDTIAGWMWLNGVTGEDKCFYTTGRLTSEMVMKAAHMKLFGRAANKHVLCYTGFDRFDAEPLPEPAAVRVVSSAA
jgi:FdhD protein